MTYVVPGFVYKPVANRGPGVQKPTLGLVLHVQQGENSPHGWFNNPSAEASSTWWVGKDGRGEQYIDPDTEHAWAQAAGNQSYHSVETEGYPGEPLTEAQVEKLALLYRFGHQRWGWPLALADKPGQPGLGWHGMGGKAWGGHTGCPSDARKAQRPLILSKAAGDPVVAAKPAAVNHNTGLATEKPWGSFPLPKGHWYGPASSDDRNHSGFWSADQRAVKQIQRQVGRPATGVYDAATADAVKAWQAHHGLAQDGAVGALTWAAMAIKD